MAPTLKKDYFIYLQEYVQKERNLRYLLRKISQDLIMQAAFEQTILLNAVYQTRELKDQPYLCDFLLLELLDGIWTNEVYCG